MMDRFKFRVAVKMPNGSHMRFEVSDIHWTDDGIFAKGDGMSFYVNRDNIVLEQCTGRKDKNGRLIYEGDIVSYRSGIGKEKETAIIAWYPHDLGHLELKTGESRNFVTFDNSQFCSDYEIIGNVHEVK